MSSNNVDGSTAGVTTRRGRKRGECVVGGTGGRVKGGRGSTRGEYEREVGIREVVL